MARDFTKNTANYARFPTLGAISAELHGASAISIAAWVYIDAFTAATAYINDVVDIFIEDVGLGALLCFDSSGANNVVKLGGRSVISDPFQARAGTVDVSTGAWHHVGGVFNYGSDTMTPYLDGSADNGGSVTFGSATWFDSNDQVKRDLISGDAEPPSTTNRQMDGRIAELAIWKADIATSGFAMLYAGMSPARVRGADLIRYVPMDGLTDPEPDYSDAVEGLDLIGTVNQADHAPVGPRYGFDPDWPGWVTTAAGLSIPIAMYHYQHQLD